MGQIADFSASPAQTQPIPQITLVRPIGMPDIGVAPFNQGQQQQEVPWPVEPPVITGREEQIG